MDGLMIFLILGVVSFGTLMAVGIYSGSVIYALVAGYCALHITASIIWKIEFNTWNPYK